MHGSTSVDIEMRENVIVKFHAKKVCNSWFRQNGLDKRLDKKAGVYRPLAPNDLDGRKSNTFNNRRLEICCLKFKIYGEVCEYNGYFLKLKKINNEKLYYYIQ